MPSQESVTLFPTAPPFKFEILVSEEKRVDCSVGSVPFLNNAVVIISLGVFSLGNASG